MLRDSVWNFIDSHASFSLDSPDEFSSLYFPLANAAGMMSSITPSLSGDVKTGQNTFLTTPVSAEELHTSRSTRNFWIYKDGLGAWSATGVSAQQIARRGTGEETSYLKAGFLWHCMTRENSAMGLKSEVISFVPCENDTVELSKITITNTSDTDAVITPTAAVPIYGRSADNFRSHRHVTSLLQRTKADQFGVTVTPTMLFDESGHSINHNTYAVVGADGSGKPPIGFFTDVESFIGEGGTLDWPQAVVENSAATAANACNSDGYEAMGALRLSTVTLHPGEQAVFILALCINGNNIEKKYLTEEKFDKCLKQNITYWEDKLNVNFKTSDHSFDMWMKWVSCEPVLRRIYGCSFLPHHDYGRGGRGWRDLWQDCIALLIMEPKKVSEMLFQNCAGMRFDGTNATIIGSGNGEFIADRNNIARVWMDHAAWPLNTISFYIDQSGDLDFLLKEQTYFKDKLTLRGKSTDSQWDEAYGTTLMCRGSKQYVGTIIEHLLIETITACLNAGKHGMLRLENADWNDALDMAAENGESVAFTSMYCGNLRVLASLLSKLKEKKGIDHLELAKEMQTLFESITNASTPEVMQKQLVGFCNSCTHEISGEKRSFKIDDITGKLEGMAERMSTLIIENEQVSSKEGFTWLNGYYDNDGTPVDGEINGNVCMTLTGQVFPIMFGVADDKLTAKIAKSADKYLFDASAGGYRLNTDFRSLRMNLGRQFGFAYGHKENGAVFSHMTVMYANALYKRGFVHEGFKAIDTLCRHCMDFKTSRIYPGVPEYINPRGRGMYHYLTGAASWLMFTYVTEVFGIKGEFGDLIFSPKLLSSQFDESGDASCETLFGDRKFNVTYHNPLHLDYGSYKIFSITLDGCVIDSKNSRFRIALDNIKALPADKTNHVEIYLKETF